MTEGFYFATGLLSSGCEFGRRQIDREVVEVRERCFAAHKGGGGTPRANARVARARVRARVRAANAARSRRRPAAQQSCAKKRAAFLGRAFFYVNSASAATAAAVVRVAATATAAVSEDALVVEEHKQKDDDEPGAAVGTKQAVRHGKPSFPKRVRLHPQYTRRGESGSCRLHRAGESGEDYSMRKTRSSFNSEFGMRNSELWSRGGLYSLTERFLRGGRSCKQEHSSIVLGTVAALICGVAVTVNRNSPDT